MNKILMYDKYDKIYREVIDIKELREYIQDLIVKVKNEKVENEFITASRAKLDIIIILDKIIEDLEVEDD